jgi:hypothetical protein
MISSSATFLFAKGCTHGLPTYIHSGGNAVRGRCDLSGGSLGSRRRARRSPRDRSNLAGQGRWRAGTGESSRDLWLTTADDRREFALLTVEPDRRHSGLRSKTAGCTVRSDLPYTPTNRCIAVPLFPSDRMFQGRFQILPPDPMRIAPVLQLRFSGRRGILLWLSSPT